MKKLFFALISIFIGITFLVVWRNLVDIKASFELIKSVNIWLVLSSVLVGILISLISAYKLLCLFDISEKRLPILFLVWGGFATYLVSSVIPFYSGGFSFAYLVSKKAKIGYGKTITTLFYDFAFSVSTVAIVGSYFVSKIAPLLALLVFYWIFTRKLSYKKTIRQFGLNFLILLASCLQIFLIFLSIGLSTNFINLFFYKSVFNAINLIPGIPFKIGQFEAGGVIAFSNLLGLPALKVNSGMILLHTSSVLLSIVIALVFINQFKVVKNFKTKADKHVKK